MMKLVMAALMVVMAVAPALAAQSQVPPPAPQEIKPAAKLSAEEQEKALKDAQRFNFSITASNARLQLRVNDVPVLFKIFRNEETVDVTYNEWLKPGLNVVDLNVQKFSESQPYLLKYEIYFQSAAQMVTGEKTVLVTSPEDLTLPLRQPFGVRTMSIPRLRLWQGDMVSLDAEEKTRLITAANDFRTKMIDALTKGDNAFLASYDRLIRDDIERAYGRIPETNAKTVERRTKIAESFSKMVNASVEASSELKMEDVDFELVGGGQLVRILRKDGSPVFRFGRGELQYVIDRPLYASMSGLWELIRLK